MSFSITVADSGSKSGSYLNGWGMESGEPLYLPSATELRQGNVFTGVCHSVQGGGVTPPSP